MWVASFSETYIFRKISKNIIDIYDNSNLGKQLNWIIDIEEGPLETLDKVEVAMNNDEVAMNNENNEFRMIKTNSANKENIILPGINQQLVSIMSLKIKNDLKKGHIKKSFTEIKIWIQNYQEAFKYMENLNKEIRHSIKIKLENWFKGTAIEGLK